MNFCSNKKKIDAFSQIVVMANVIMLGVAEPLLPDGYQGPAPTAPTWRNGRPR
jgi:hypothetical protein